MKKCKLNKIKNGMLLFFNFKIYSPQLVCFLSCLARQLSQLMVGSCKNRLIIVLIISFLLAAISMVVSEIFRKSPFSFAKPQPSTIFGVSRKGTISGTRKFFPRSKIMFKSMCTTSPVRWQIVTLSPCLMKKYFVTKQSQN